MVEGMMAGEVVCDVKHKLRVDCGSRRPGDRCEEECGVQENFADPPYSPLGREKIQRGGESVEAGVSK